MDILQSIEATARSVGDGAHETPEHRTSLAAFQEMFPDAFYVVDGVPVPFSFDTYTGLEVNLPSGNPLYIGKPSSGIVSLIEPVVTADVSLPSVREDFLSINRGMNIALDTGIIEPLVEAVEEFASFDHTSELSAQVPVEVRNQNIPLGLAIEGILVEHFYSYDNINILVIGSGRTCSDFSRLTRYFKRVDKAFKVWSIDRFHDADYSRVGAFRPNFSDHYREDFLKCDFGSQKFDLIIANYTVQYGNQSPGAFFQRVDWLLTQRGHFISCLSLLQPLLAQDSPDVILTSFTDVSFNVEVNKKKFVDSVVSPRHFDVFAHFRCVDYFPANQCFSIWPSSSSLVRSCNPSDPLYSMFGILHVFPVSSVGNFGLFSEVSSLPPGSYPKLIHPRPCELSDLPFYIGARETVCAEKTDGLPGLLFCRSGVAHVSVVDRTFRADCDSAVGVSSAFQIEVTSLLPLRFEICETIFRDDFYLHGPYAQAYRDRDKPLYKKWDDIESFECRPNFEGVVFSPIYGPSYDVVFKMPSLVFSKKRPTLDIMMEVGTPGFRGWTQCHLKVNELALFEVDAERNLVRHRTDKFTFSSVREAAVYSRHVTSDVLFGLFGVHVDKQDDSFLTCSLESLPKEEQFVIRETIDSVKGVFVGSHYTSFRSVSKYFRGGLDVFLAYIVPYLACCDGNSVRTNFALRDFSWYNPAPYKAAAPDSLLKLDFLF